MSVDQEELAILREVARLAGEWGVAFAEFQVAPTPERRKKAAKLAREMSEALGVYARFKAERN